MEGSEAGLQIKMWLLPVWRPHGADTKYGNTERISQLFGIEGEGDIEYFDRHREHPKTTKQNHNCPLRTIEYGSSLQHMAVDHSSTWIQTRGGKGRQFTRREHVVRRSSFYFFISFSSFHTERRRTTNGLWKMATKKKGRIGSTLMVTTVQILLQQIVHRERDSQRHWKQLKMKDTWNARFISKIVRRSNELYCAALKQNLWSGLAENQILQDTAAVAKESNS